MPTPGVVSTRDVPGMPRSSIPILKQAGVHALSEGMNGRMVPFPSWNRSILTEIYLCHACSCPEILRTEMAGQVPVNAPPVFAWEDTASGESMLTLWHFGGYGSVGDKDWLIRIPGSSHALAYCWRGDNAGPPGTAAEVSRPFSSWNRPTLTEIYLCNACSCQEILRVKTAGQVLKNVASVRAHPMMAKYPRAQVITSAGD
jgi:hypothetical protein